MDVAVEKVRQAAAVEALTPAAAPRGARAEVKVGVRVEAQAARDK